MISSELGPVHEWMLFQEFSSSSPVFIPLVTTCRSPRSGHRRRTGEAPSFASMGRSDPCQQPMLEDPPTSHIHMSENITIADYAYPSKLPCSNCPPPIYSMQRAWKPKESLT